MTSISLKPHNYKNTLSFLLNLLATPAGKSNFQNLTFFYLWFACYDQFGGTVDLTPDVINQLTAMNKEGKAPGNPYEADTLEKRKLHQELVRTLGVPPDILNLDKYRPSEVGLIWSTIMGNTENPLAPFKTEIEKLSSQDTQRPIPLSKDVVASLGAPTTEDSNKSETHTEWRFEQFLMNDNPEDLLTPLYLFLANIGLIFSREQLAVTDLGFALAHNKTLNYLVTQYLISIDRDNESLGQALNLPDDYLNEFLVGRKEEPLFFAPKTDKVMTPVTDYWRNLFGSLHKSSSDFYRGFLRPMQKEYSAYSMGQISQQDTAYIDKLLSNEQDNHNTNILLYGSSSVDKNSVAIEIAKRSGFTPYSIPKDIPEDSKLHACYLAQRTLTHIEKEENGEQNKKPLLVIPEADKVLTKTQRGTVRLIFFSVEMDEDKEDSAIEGELLQRNPIPSLWIVRNPNNISENNLGRFLFSSEVQPISREKRKQEIGRVFSPLHVSDDFIQEMSTNTQLGEFQLESAVRFTQKQLHGVQLVETELQQQEESLLRVAIQKSQKLLGRSKKEDLRVSSTKYDLNYLNLSSLYSIEQIINALKKRKRGNMCFYGLPGTGKTMLAEHLAVALDLPLKIVRASDIMGKYVGETEKGIRLMFDSAQEEDCILLLDEADSFLRDRTSARYAWEISAVNELLQGMERFNGIFVCTTNLFNNLDQACLRRFVFKIEFKALTQEQAWKMFTTEVDLTATKKSDIDELKSLLMGIHNLTPGDFAVIKNQNVLMDIELSPTQWISALTLEVKAKRMDREIQQSLNGLGHEQQ